MDKNLLCGTAITGVIAGLSFFAAGYIAPDATSQVVVGAIVVAIVTFLSQFKSKTETISAPIQTMQDDVTLAKNKNGCAPPLIIGIRWG
jgi:hypothetical protein